MFDGSFVVALASIFLVLILLSSLWYAIVSAPIILPVIIIITVIVILGY